MNKFSRREFLKLGGGALAAAFLKELAMPKWALAKLEEVLDKREFIKESFDEGIKRLRKEVFESETERYFVFVKKGETAGWLNIEDKMSVDMGFSINLLPMLEDGGIEEMHFVHTHPLAIAEADKLLPPSALREIRIKQKSNFPLLPSSSDIAVLAKQKRFLLDKKLPAKITHSVLDSAGRWTYDVDLNHPEIQKISESKEPLKENETKSEDELLVMSPEESTLSRMGLELLSRQELFYKDSRGINPQNLEELIEWYGTKYGAKLEFKRYGD